MHQANKGAKQIETQTMQFAVEDARMHITLPVSCHSGDEEL